jgi:hypothetical protein
MQHIILGPNKGESSSHPVYFVGESMEMEGVLGIELLTGVETLPGGRGETGKPSPGAGRSVAT